MTIEMRGTFRRVEADITAHLRMLHRTEKRDGGRRFAASVAIFDHDTMTPAVPGATPTLTPDDLEGTRPSYRIVDEGAGLHRRGRSLRRRPARRAHRAVRRHLRLGRPDSLTRPVTPQTSISGPTESEQCGNVLSTPPLQPRMNVKVTALRPHHHNPRQA